MNSKILIVDDEQRVLDGIKRYLGREYRMDTALGPEEALSKISKDGPYSVIISDLRMPKMDGIQLLIRVKEISPDTTRIILTGYAELESAIEAVNKGHIFRFLTKPCSPEILRKTIEQGIRQYELIVSERTLLEKTLKGIVSVLMEVLSLLNPEAWDRAMRIKEYTKMILNGLGIEDNWEIETASMLSQIGCIMLSEETIKKICSGKPLTPEETQLYEMSPMISYDLLCHIPRMEKVAEIIRYMDKNFDGTGIPKDDIRGDKIPLGSRILKVAVDFDTINNELHDPLKSIQHLKERGQYYDPKILEAFNDALYGKKESKVRYLKLSELKPGMKLEQDIKTLKGRLLISSGHQLNEVTIRKLLAYREIEKIPEPIKVLVQDYI